VTGEPPVVDPPVIAPGQAVGMPQRTVAQRRGRAAESGAADGLVALGWQILGRNVRVGHGELDIVAVDAGPPPALVFVEVRHRSGRDHGLPEESLDPAKRAALRRAVQRLLAAGQLPDGTRLPLLPIRVDLICSDSAGQGGPRLRHHRGIGLGRRS
jgi:putative endonuclease